MKINLNGIFVPVITPFDDSNEKLDITMLRNNIEKLNRTDISGYMPLGSNGEFASLTDDEALSVIKEIKEAADPNKSVFAGIGRESTKITIEFCKKVSEIGVDAVFVLTPHYFPKQMTQDILMEYYIKVSEQSEVPIILYSAPGYAGGVMIEPKTAEKLSEHENIIGMKDTSPYPISNYIDCIDNNREFSLLAGTMGKFLEGLLAGATGGVLSSANYMPEVCCDLYNLVKQGRENEAKQIHQMIVDLAKKTTAPYGVSGVKAAMNACGYPCGVPRSPLESLSEDIKNTLESNLKQGINSIKKIYNEECRV